MVYSITSTRSTPLGTCWVQAQLALRDWFYGCNHMAVHPLAQALSILTLLGQVPPVGSERQRSAAQHPSSERPYYVPAALSQTRHLHLSLESVRPYGIA